MDAKTRARNHAYFLMEEALKLYGDRELAASNVKEDIARWADMVMPDEICQLMRVALREYDPWDAPAAMGGEIEQWLAAYEDKCACGRPPVYCVCP